MTDISRIATWLDARAPHDALLSMTADEIIVALLTRIEALEADVAALKATAERADDTALPPDDE